MTQVIFTSKQRFSMAFMTYLLLEITFLYKGQEQSRLVSPQIGRIGK